MMSTAALPVRGGRRSFEPDSRYTHSQPIAERTDEATGAKIKVYAAGYPRGYADIIAFSYFPSTYGGIR